MKKRMIIPLLVPFLWLSLPVNASAMEIPIVTQAEIAEEDYQAELQLLACVVYAEAGNQDMTGKRLVAGTILNRVDSAAYPNSITEVVYQPGQFSCVKDGNLDKAFWNVTDDCFRAVTAELVQRTDKSILYFTAGGYGQYGTPAFQHGGHWFSK